MNQFQKYPVPVVALSALICISSNMEAFAQQGGRPAPQTPEVHTQPVAPQAGSSTESNAPKNAATAQTMPDRSTSGVPGRRVMEGEVTAIGFKDVPVDEDIIQFIMASTGKVVMPVNLTTLKTKKVTLINDQPMSRAYALDLLFEALRLNGIGVIEREDVIILDTIENMKNSSNLPVLTADDDVMKRNDLATYIVKYFRLRESNAETVADHLDDNMPDWASIAADTTSNQIIMYGTVGFAQTIQRQIDVLDHFFVNIKTETFHLQYADAQQVADNVLDLFEDTSNGQSAQRAQRPQRGARTNAPNQPGAQPGIPTAGPAIPLKLTVNVQQNSVTVSAEPPKVAQIEQLIRNDFDLPRREGTAKVYKLVYTDPIKVRDTLQTLLGQGGGAGQRATGGRAGGGFQAGGGQASGVTESIGNIYQIEAYSDSNSLVVLSKTEEALDWLDTVVDGLDQPSDVYLPLFVELKHANAVSLAEELNALLSEAGAGATIERPGDTLTAGGLQSLSDTSQSAGSNTGTTGGGSSNNTMTFPWQRGRQDETRADPSPLIGTVRIVPIIRQNALTIVCPVSLREPMRHLITLYDRPARQVMIEAVIAQIELSDDSALGVRFSSDSLTSALSDNSFRGSASLEGSKDDILGSAFDTSKLDVGMDVNVLIQAINEKNNVRVLQRPRVFTADNQEAKFFNGQDIPFITNSQVTDQGGQTQSFDYKEVGVLLNVRPRITAERDIDMDINLELSNLVPGQTLFGGAILDRRETNSRIIVRNHQTIVLSGILREDESETTRGVPLLSDIPILGELFKSREKSNTRTELIAFITPVVVDNPAANDENFNADERRYLEELTGPLKDQVKRSKQSIRDQITGHITNGRPSPTPANEAEAPVEQPESVRPLPESSTDESWEEVKPN